VRNTKPTERLKKSSALEMSKISPENLSLNMKDNLIVPQKLLTIRTPLEKKLGQYSNYWGKQMTPLALSTCLLGYCCIHNHFLPSLSIHMTVALGTYHQTNG
jgi:hypothetical protein